MGKRILERFEEIFVFPILEVVIYNGTGWCEKKKKLRFCDGFCKEHKVKCNNK